MATIELIPAFAKRKAFVSNGEPLIAQRAWLIVDDDRRFSNELVYHTKCALSAHRFSEVATLDLAKEPARAVQGIIIEPNLPGSHWYRTVHAIARLYSDKVLVVMTAYPSEALMHETAALGIRHYFAKPTSPELVILGLEQHSSFSSAAPARSLALVEWEYINQTLLECGGNMSHAAEILEIPRQTLYRKLRKVPAQAPRHARDAVADHDYNHAQRS